MRWVHGALIIFGGPATPALPDALRHVHPRRSMSRVPELRWDLWRRVCTFPDVHAPELAPVDGRRVSMPPRHSHRAQRLCDPRRTSHIICFIYLGSREYLRRVRVSLTTGLTGARLDASRTSQHAVVHTAAAPHFRRCSRCFIAPLTIVDGCAPAIPRR
ncbi:hypothetical protein HYPSUDRAFT_403241 [Hypholoma sublateritium FD-334 SS-4]|uniref:Uncharacterized protein n=1 Tax=Hypholoma sublateritium (strain FD-334 SS-4) TaxID=945553 RepID=A0A0D2P3L6_HYPSF|nr:hypothetical protein HYPSUDRAFT_403241 [Hypholoma sublateritium FD-334 SS-4]